MVCPPGGGASRRSRNPAAISAGRCRLSRAAGAGSRAGGASSTGSCSRGRAGGSCREATLKAGPRHARGLDERLEVAGGEAADRVAAFERLDAAGTKPALQPASRVRRRLPPRARLSWRAFAQASSHGRRRPLAAAHQRGLRSRRAGRRPSRADLLQRTATPARFAGRPIVAAPRSSRLVAGVGARCAGGGAFAAAATDALWRPATAACSAGDGDGGGDRAGERRS